MQKGMRLAVAQLAPTLGAVDDNLKRAGEAVAGASGSDLVVFPELFASGYSVGTLDDDPSIRADDPRLLGLATDRAVLMGFAEHAGRGPHTYNSAAYYQGGQLLHVHRKLYLPTYSIFEERKHFTAGPSMRAFDAGGTRMAVLVCNDAWQPQLAFLATQDGAQILLVPTASAQSLFPDRYDSREYWYDITRFYARMFQLYVVFANRVGAEGQLRFWGGSHVVNPWGEVVAEASGDEQLLEVEIDLDEVRRRRRSIPLVKEARLGLIQREAARIVDEGGDL